MNPRSTDSKADTLTTTPWRRYDTHLGEVINRAKFDVCTSVALEELKHPERQTDTHACAERIALHSTDGQEANFLTLVGL